MLTWINKKRNKKGFTLVELVVVIAILGILAAIAIPRLGSSQKSARIATHNANVRILKSVATMYLADHPYYVDDELPENDLKEYLDGDEYPKVPTGLDDLKDSSTDENTIEGPYIVSLDDDGNIVVTPGEYKPEEDAD